MPEQMHAGFDRTYCYPNTHVLKNKLNIHDSDRLHDAERKLTSVRLHELADTDTAQPAFDARHLKAIHRHIFQDIYGWAGEFRTVDIAKGNMFCRVIFIEDQLDYVFRQLRRENYLENVKDTSEMGERLGYYLAEINAVHPFREGNGRTQREFIRQLAEHNGYHLDYSKIPDGALLQASIKSFQQDYTDMQKLITDALTKENPDEKHKNQTSSREERIKRAERAFGHISGQIPADNDCGYK